ncbi:hypothetical protein [Cribrihabitans pelagius]|uniref:hypothetical protein n=1 Tax=Cribrihabitans pelagius TaxID=1765746 RepID=UPI003B590684
MTRLLKASAPPPPGLQVRLEELEARLSELDSELAAPAPEPVRFNPNLSELYRTKVAQLAATLANPDIRTEALETVRNLIERVVVSHENGQATVALEGALAAMFGLAHNAKSPSGEGLDGNTLECSVKVDTSGNLWPTWSTTWADCDGFSAELRRPNGSRPSNLQR